MNGLQLRPRGNAVMMLFFPNQLDNSPLEGTLSWISDIRRRRIGDLSGWKDDARYKATFAWLLRDLKRSVERNS